MGHVQGFQIQFRQVVRRQIDELIVADVQFGERRDADQRSTERLQLVVVQLQVFDAGGGHAYNLKRSRVRLINGARQTVATGRAPLLLLQHTSEWPPSLEIRLCDKSTSFSSFSPLISANENSVMLLYDKLISDSWVSGNSELFKCLMQLLLSSNTSIIFACSNSSDASCTEKRNGYYLR